MAAPTVVSRTLLDTGDWEIKFSDNTVAIVKAVIPTDFSSSPPVPNFGSGGGGGGGGAVTVADGADVAQGTTTDTSSASTIVGILKAIKAAVQGTLGISGTVTANAGTSLNTSALALEAGNLATLAGAISGAKAKTTIADGDNTTFGAKADAKSAATDITAISAMSVFKQISASVQAIAASIAGTVAVSIASAIAVTQSGTWTVQPGNTANTTAWKTDGSAVTQPVSGTVTANAGTNTSTAALALETGGNLATVAGAVSSSKMATKSADGDFVTLGTKTDAASTSTDGTSTSIVSVLKQISKTLQAQLPFGYQNAAAALPVVLAAPDNSVDSQVSIATSSTVLLAGRAKRLRAVFKNTDTANPVYINFANGAATTADFPIKAGESIEMRGTGAVKAIATGSSVNVSVLEEYYT